MGQGYSINVSAGSAGIDVPELADLETERTLGAARFLKTIRARHKDGLVIAKVFIKPYPTLKLTTYTEALLHERRLLADVPNALAYHRIVETATNGYLVRQYIHSSLYDRISTNPSLENIERKWIAYQLLCAVRDSHARNIYHGDIKTENMLVTTWNWLYLTDYSSSFKPTRLPEDNPATFSIFFDTTGRRICYLAPERFVTSADLKDNEADSKDDESEAGIKRHWHKLSYAMDIFSVGCVIAELFTEKPTFTLSQLFRYRKGEYDPTHTTLNSIKDDNIREMVASMIQLNPEKRFEAEEYLNFWRGKAFPEYFYSFLHQYMHVITDPTSGRAPVNAGKKNSGGSDDRVDRIYADFDKISYFLAFDQEDDSIPQRAPSQLTSALDLFPLQVDLPNNRHAAASRADGTHDNGALLFLNVIVSSLRSTARASSRIRGCELLLALGERLTDEAKLDRVLPYAMALLEDESENVRMVALRTITQLLAIVTVLSPMNVFIFPNYVLPRSHKFLSSHFFKNSAPLRATYAACLASLATTAARFLDMMQALRADGSLPSTDPEAEDDLAAYAAYQNSYDFTREDLVQHFETQVKVFLTDEDSSVRRAFLGSVTGLCVFFGESLASDLILTHLNTYLNGDDWQLKCTFFETIVGVAAFIGGQNLEDFILPIMVQALTDPEETVTESVIRSLASMARLGLFQRWTLVELVLVVTRFSLHPNAWLREAAVEFIAAATTYLSDADIWSMIMPLVKPVLKVSTVDLSELTVLDALQKPFPRSALDMAKTWAAKTDKGLFWKQSQQGRSFAFEAGSNKALMDFYRDINPRPLAKIAKNEEDESWLSSMRNAGMRSEDEVKLLALRDYIWRLSLRSTSDASTQPLSRYNDVVPLTALRVPLQNVLFDEDVQFYEQFRPDDNYKKQEKKTIEEALHDAATAAQASLAATETVVSEMAASQIGTRKDQALPADGKQPSNGTDQISVDDKVMSHRQKMTNLDNPSYLSSSPTSTIASAASRGQTPGLRHRGSAMNLLRRAEATGKASAETGTDNTNAVGRVDAPSNHHLPDLSSPPASGQGTPQKARPKFQTSHSYRGGDPNVLKLLDSVYTSAYPMDAVEFGPQIQGIKRMPLTTSSSSAAVGQWAPQGQLVAVLGEHLGSINCIAVSPDHVFFITGSDDGTVRVWDTARLERNLAYRSRQVHKHGNDVQVTSLCFVEQTHTFISTGSDGSLNVVKVDFSEPGGMPRYGKLQILRDWKIPSKANRTESAISVEHSRVDGQSLCIILTNLSRVLAIDLQTMAIVYELQNPIQHGAPTTFCVQRRRQWLLIGTSHGVLDLWDLRFRIRLRSWTVRNPHPITKLTLHPSRRSNHRVKVCVSGLTDPGHISVWDLEKVMCSEIYHISDVSGEQLSARDFELINVDDEKAELPSRILGAISLDPNFAPENQSAGVGKEVKSGNELVTGAVRSFVMSMHVPLDGSEPRHSFLISAGPDWKIRFWDSDRLSASIVVNGLEAAPSTTEEKTTFGTAMLGNDTRVYSQRINPATSSDQDPQPSASSSGRTSSASGRRETDSSSGRTEKARKKEGRENKVSRYDVIRASAQHLLQGHKDTVTAVALLERPFGMIVSADRAGMIYVFM